MASTLEGIVLKYADRIAYINHDIDDACRAGIMTLEDIPKDIIELLGERHGQRINSMVSSVIEASTGKPQISMTEDVGDATDRLRSFLFEAVYRNPVAKSEESKAKEMLAILYDHFVKHPEEIPEPYSKFIESDSVERCACDYISSLTDRSAIDLYKNLFIPSVWRTPENNV